MNIGKENLSLGENSPLLLQESYTRYRLYVADTPHYPHRISQKIQYRFKQKAFYRSFILRL